MSKIKWGIIGCGDVTEVKSGPAFNKVKNSALVAVMRRNGAKAEDYARRHNVPRLYSDAQQLVDDPEVNAIYVATPPQSHEEYTIRALQAGKPVYVEKPMTVNSASAERMLQSSIETGTKLCVAHYKFVMYACAEEYWYCTENFMKLKMSQKRYDFENVRGWM